MLNKDILSAISEYTRKMTSDVTLVLQPGEHGKRQELVDFLTQLVSASDRLSLVEADRQLASGISFTLESNNEPTGVIFSGIPGGHEFNSLILAVLQAGGTGNKLDAGITQLIASVKDKLHFEVFVSLSCHNCPDVVQALNQFALINPNISSEMIDGGLFPEVIEERSIQGVPSVYLNGELFANGKIDAAQLLAKLQDSYQLKADTSNVEKLPQQDVTVIGGGPAGVAAAIYSARKGLKVTMVADRLGGQVKDTVGIENLISVSQTTGSQLTGNMQQHLSDYDITIKEHVSVANIEKGDTKHITLSSGEEIDSRTVIVATGAKWRELGVPGEKENIGNGVAYCPHCDGPFFKGKDVAVIGGGNSGIEAALDLAGMVNHVTVFEFLTELKADQLLVEKAQANDKITIITNAQTKEIIADNGKVVAIDYIDRETQEVHRKHLAGVFVQIGLVPNSEFVRGVVEQTPYGEIVIDEKGQTSEPGIFACGDVTTVPYKQIVIAMGEGAKASLAAFDYLIRQ